MPGLLPIGTFHHAHVTIAPLGEALVEIDEPLTQLRVIDIAAVHIQEHLLHVGIRLRRQRGVARQLGRWNGIPLPRQIVKKAVPHRGLPIPTFQGEPASAAVGEPGDRRGTLCAEQELELSELVRLKSARRFKPGAERQELERRHRFEDVQLGDQYLEDGEDPLQRMPHAMRLVASKQRRDVIEFVQQLLEPQLVHLVDDDEQQLVVLWRTRSRLLQREQRIDVQVALVGHHRIWTVAHVASPTPLAGMLSGPVAWICISPG